MNWAPIPKYTETYEISDTGIIRRLRGSTRAPEGFVLKQTPTRDGYLAVGLTRAGRQRTFNAVHRLVWEAHVGPIPTGLVINHLNGIKSDNQLTNLACVTVAENVRHGFNELGRKRGGEKLNKKAVLVMRHAVDRRLATLRNLARKYGVTQSCVSSVVTGKTWRHVGGPITAPRVTSQSAQAVAARISDDTVREIILRVRKGENVEALANEIGVNKRSIYNWVQGRARKHVLDSLS